MYTLVDERGRDVVSCGTHVWDGDAKGSDTRQENGRERERERERLNARLRGRLAVERR